jgi:membrane protease YdiL (CAAX protease family)
MVGHQRVKSPLSQLGIFLGLFGAGFLIISLLMAVVLMTLGLSGPDVDWTNPRVLPMMKVIQAVSSIFIFFLPAVVFALICYHRKPFRALGFKKAEGTLTYILSIVGILAAFPFVMWLGEINHSIPLPEWMVNLEKDAMKQMQAFLKTQGPWDIIVNVFLMAFLPAVCEEVCFRGALQRIVIQLTRNPWLGIILTSVFFSALHLQFQGFLPRMFLGVLLGAMFWYSRSLWPSIAAHFAYNAAQVIAVSFAPEYIDKNPSVPIFAALVSGLIVIAILWKLKTDSTVSFENEYESEELNRNNQFIA